MTLTSMLETVNMRGPRRSATVMEQEVPLIGAGWINVAIVGIGVGAMLWAVTGGAYVQTIVGLLAAYIVSASGFNVVVGLSGQMAFGQAGFMAVGAYTYAVLMERNASWLAAATAGVALSTVLAALVGVAVLRTRHIYLALVTLVFAEGAVRVIQIVPATHQDQGIGVALLGTEFFIPAIVAAVAAVVLVDRLTRSHYGRALVMVRSDEETAYAMGVNVARFRVGAFALSGAMGGVGGILMSAAFGYITPENFTSNLSLLILVMIVVGGLGSVWGPAIGAAVIVEVGQLLQGTLDIQPIVYGAILVLMLMILPRGVVSLPGEVRRVARGEIHWGLFPSRLTLLLRSVAKRG